MKQLLLTISLISLYSFQLMAQTSMPNSLAEILNTDFFKEYEEVRNRAHTSVKAFKAMAADENFSQEDIEAVKDAYETSADRFNAILINLKNDLLSKKNRKSLIRFPDAYSNNLEKELEYANEYYEQTFRKEIARVTNGEILGMAFLEMVPVIVKGMQVAIGVIKKFQAEIRDYNDAMLQQHLVEKYKFEDWDDLY